jgi:hypothetical protein
MTVGVFGTGASACAYVISSKKEKKGQEEADREEGRNREDESGNGAAPVGVWKEMIQKNVKARMSRGGSLFGTGV